jgi:hypothetical protein
MGLAKHAVGSRRPTLQRCLHQFDALLEQPADE